MSAGLTPGARLARYRTALEGRDGPLAFVDLDAMWHNAADLLRRADGKRIRVASKSLRCRDLLRRALDHDAGFEGLLTFTLPETLWLDECGFEDLVVAYPTTDRAALAALAERTAAAPDTAPVVMVDSLDHLALIEAAAGEITQRSGAPIRVCLDFDASLWMVAERVKIGAKRSPVHAPEDARALAVAIEACPATRLVGMMSYEGHIAGQGDQIPGEKLKSLAIQKMQARSFAELSERRAHAVELVSQVAALEFVNAGGTGDLELVATEPAMTEATAGSGFYAPTLFDNYSRFTPEPAAFFAQPVVRRPGPGVVTALGGGYLASGTGGPDRVPTPYLPEGLSLDSMEGAGEVQTPLLGDAADELSIGDLVFFRHTKAGELCERFATLLLIEGDAVVDEVPTYRGEGQTFL